MRPRTLKQINPCPMGVRLMLIHVLGRDRGGSDYTVDTG